MILLAESIAVDDLIHGFMALLAVWGGYKVVIEIVQAITTRHDKEKNWSEMESKLTNNIQEERDKIYDRYDRQLEDIKREIEQNHCETEAKMQELSSGMIMLTKSIRAILEGQMEQGLNGTVAKAKERLDDFIDKQAWD